MKTQKLAEILHICSVDAYSHPRSRSGDEWNMYRKNIAECLLNICDIDIKKDPLAGDPAERDTKPPLRHWLKSLRRHLKMKTIMVLIMVLMVAGNASSVVVSRHPNSEMKTFHHRTELTECQKQTIRSLSGIKYTHFGRYEASVEKAKMYSWDEIESEVIDIIMLLNDYRAGVFGCFDTDSFVADPSLEFDPDTTGEIYILTGVDNDSVTISKEQFERIKKALRLVATLFRLNMEHPADYGLIGCNKRFIIDVYNEIK